MKKLKLLIMSVMMTILLVLPVAAFVTVPIEGLSMDISSITLNVGQTLNIRVTYTPSNTTQKLIKFTTSDTNVATIAPNGTITAVSNGTATIKAVSGNNSNIYVDCVITVISPTTPPAQTIPLPTTPPATSTPEPSPTVNTPNQPDANAVKVIELSAGSNYCLAIKSDGTLWAWGSNQNGQLGDGTQIDRNHPVQINKDKDWLKIAAGTTHSLAIKKDGTLWTWGNNACGQLGNGTTTKKLIPIRVSNDTTFSQIAAGGNYSLAIKKDGTLWECGDISRSVLDKKNMFLAKWRQLGTDTNWQNISISSNHVLALKENGTIWAWGAGGNGQFGNGNVSNNVRYPLQVGKQNDWIRISAGNGYSIAQKKDGSLWRWGLSSGKNFLIPKKIGNDIDWISISASSFMAAIKMDGSMWTWGKDNGQGGINETINEVNNIPYKVGVDNDWQFVDSGNSYSVALKKDGTLYSWGNNRYGELGYGDTIVRATPVQIGNQLDWDKVYAGSNHTLAIKKDGTLWAWGSNLFGEIGNLNIGAKTLEPVQVGTDNNWGKVAASPFTSLALTKDGTLWGWGSNKNGIISTDKREIVYPPVRIGYNSEWLDISSSSTMVYGLKKDGTIWVWGMDLNNNLFDEKTVNHMTKLDPKMIGKDNDWSMIYSGGNHGDNNVMALKKDGSVWCWGFENYSIQNKDIYKDGHNFIRLGTENDWQSIASGSLYSCAIKKDGTLWCWKLNKHTKNNKFDTKPVKIGKEKNWSKISISGRHVILLKKDGSLWGFGDNNSGELGNGTRINSSIPILVDSKSKWKYISAGANYSTAIMSDGSLWSWGDNYNNQLGIMKPNYQAIPWNIIFQE